MKSTFSYKNQIISDILFLIYITEYSPIFTIES